MPTTRPKRTRRRDDHLDLVFSALSDRKRRAILRRLSRGPATVTELAEPFDISLPAVSRHVKVLEHAGLVDRTVDGRIHHCSLDPSALQTVDAWIAHYRGFWNERLDALALFVE